MFYSICASDAHKAHNYLNAVDLYSVLIGLNPDNSDYATNRGYCYLKLNRVDLAIDDFTRAVEAGPTKFIPRLNRSAAYIRANQPDKALEDLNIAITLTKKEKQISLARNNRIDALMNLGDLEQAQKEIDLTGDFGMPAEKKCVMAQFAIAKGNIDQGLKLAQEAIKTGLKEPASYLDAAKVFNKANREEEEKTCIDKAQELMKSFREDTVAKRVLSSVSTALIFGFIFSFSGVGYLCSDFYLQFALYMILIFLGAALVRSYGLILSFVLLGSIFADWYFVPVYGLYEIKVEQAEPVNKKQKDLDLSTILSRADSKDLKEKVILYRRIADAGDSSKTIKNLNRLQNDYREKGLLVVGVIDKSGLLSKKGDSQKKKLPSKANFPIISEEAPAETIIEALDLSWARHRLIVSGADNHVLAEGFANANLNGLVKKSVLLLNSGNDRSKSLTGKKLTVLPIGLYYCMIIFALLGGTIDLLLLKKYGLAKKLVVELPAIG